MAKDVDCLVVGGGPAGLSAAIYLARFRMTVLVIDGGESRAALIPCTRNHAGFPGGISGVELLRRMQEQALEYGVRYGRGRVSKLKLRQPGFEASTSVGKVEANAVLLATGVTNLRPQIADDIHDQALQDGRIRYCPVCDGYEVIDEVVAVIGTGERGVKESQFLRSFTKAVTLAPADQHTLTEEERNKLDQAGISVIDSPARDFQLDGNKISFAVGAERQMFDAIYPALGSTIHSTLAAELGAECTEEGCIKVDGHQRTTVPFLYAAGDVVAGLDQISHAMGEAGVAATAIRNDAAALTPIYR